MKPDVRLRRPLLLILKGRKIMGKVYKPMRSLPFVSFCSLCGLVGVLAAQTDSKQDKKQDSSGKRETVARPMTEKERKKQEAKLKKELETPWKKWLNEEVVYIITDEEKAAFKKFANDEERE